MADKETDSVRHRKNTQLKVDSSKNWLDMMGKNYNNN